MNINNQGLMAENLSKRALIIHQRITEALNPSVLKIQDDSRHHQNHAEAKQSGGGHFALLVVSEAFRNKTTVARHRMIYSALEGLIGPEIHALQIQAKTPEESLS